MLYLSEIVDCSWWSVHTFCTLRDSVHIVFFLTERCLLGAGQNLIKRFIKKCSQLFLDGIVASGERFVSVWPICSHKWAFPVFVVILSVCHIKLRLAKIRFSFIVYSEVTDTFLKSRNVQLEALRKRGRVQHFESIRTLLNGND